MKLNTLFIYPKQKVKVKTINDFQIHRLKKDMDILAVGMEEKIENSIGVGFYPVKPAGN
jgi:hypothetical protein